MYVSCDASHNVFTAEVVCLWCAGGTFVVSRRNSELIYQYNIRLCCLLTSWISGVLSITCVSRVDYFFREFPIVTFGAPFRYSKVKDISLYYRRNTILSQAQFTSEPRTGSTHTTNVPTAHNRREYILCEASQLTYIEFRISVVICIFIDSYAAF